jgi:glycosyltransferase involved in cell wall biosynthesis
MAREAEKQFRVSSDPIAGEPAKAPGAAEETILGADTAGTSPSGCCLVIIPAFAEADTISGVILAVRRTLADCAVVVVDDGSPDATAEPARAAGATVLRHPTNLGYGAALQTGYKYAVRKGYSLIAQMDADGQHDPASLPALLAPVQRGETDVALGSRLTRRDGTWRCMLPKVLACWSNFAPG